MESGVKVVRLVDLGDEVQPQRHLVAAVVVADGWTHTCNSDSLYLCSLRRQLKPDPFNYDCDYAVSGCMQCVERLENDINRLADRRMAG